MVRKIVAEQPVKEKEIIYVPERSLGRIIGEEGISIRIFFLCG